MACTLHRVDGDGGSLNVDLVKQFRDRRDFVRLLFGRHLTQRNVKVGNPRTHDVQRSRRRFVMSCVDLSDSESSNN